MKAYYQARYLQKGGYKLRDNLYRKIIYIIKDYPLYKTVLTATDTAELDLVQIMQWAKDDNASSVEREAIPLANAKVYYDAINEAIEQIPCEYADEIFHHVVHGKQYKYIDIAHEQTLKIWTQRFVWHVAHNLGEI